MTKKESLIISAFAIAIIIMIVAVSVLIARVVSRDNACREAGGVVYRSICLDPDYIITPGG